MTSTLTTAASITETSTTTAISISTLLTTATATPSPPTTTTTEREIYYPPASTHFALSVPVITGIVVAGVGFLVLLALTAAITVCILDRKKESKSERAERKREEKMAKGKEKERLDSVAGTEDSSVIAAAAAAAAGAEVHEHGTGTADVGAAVIGPRYASMIGVDNGKAGGGEGGPGPGLGSAPAQHQQSRQRERTIIHLPVHVADLGTPRQQSQMVQYEREDPDDADRDERGFRRGASWWHPEL